MKIITDKAAYIQKNDLGYLNNSDIAIPASIFLKTFGNDITVIDDTNRYEFVEYNEPNEIEFFKGIDWMIDYDEVKDLSEDEIISLGQSIADERNAIAKRFNAMSFDERKKNINMATKCDLLDFKMYSLRDILLFKRGHLKMTLPGEKVFSTELEQETGIKKMVKAIFNKMKK